MCHQNDGFGGIVFDVCKEVIAFTLECLIANCEHFIKYEDISLGLDGYGKRQTNLHAGRVILQLLVHELFKLCEFYDVIVHGVDFIASETKQGTVEIHILTTGEFRVETHSKFDEWHQLPVDLDGAGVWNVDSRDKFQQGGFSRTVTTDNAKEIALTHFEINITKHMLLFVAFDAFCPIDYQLL